MAKWYCSSCNNEIALSHVKKHLSTRKHIYNIITEIHNRITDIKKEVIEFNLEEKEIQDKHNKLALKPAPRSIKTKPILTPRITVEILDKALKNSTVSYDLNLLNKNHDPTKQLMIPQMYVANILQEELETMKGLKNFGTIKISFVKQLDADKTVHKTGFFNSNVKTILSENYIDINLQNLLKKNLI